jgi:tetratricopeptide (TPR) repeat protein
MTTLFQAQQENMYSDFALTTYKQLCQAKLDADKGHLIKAKKAYYKAINEVSNEHPEIDIPLQFAAECLNTLVILGEFEDAQKLAQKVANAANASGFTAEIIDKYQNDSEYQKRFTQFKQHHQDGSKYYAEGRYLEASTEYKAALSLAPTNSGAALNMIQCLLQLASKEKKQQSYLTECKEYFKLLDGIQLPRQQQERYQELKQSLNKLTQK